jgi:HAD superfamily hydrolase (TIGR01509 family)
VRPARRVRGVILDVDGTLVDSNRLHARAWIDAFTEAGLDAGGVDRVQRLIGMGSDKLLPAAVGVDSESELGKRLSERRGEHFRQRYLDRVRAIPGSRELPAAVRDRGLGVAVASSAKPDELRLLLERAGAAWLAELATSADEVDRSKPDPDVVQAALGRLGLEGREALMIGDTPYDVEAARKAGVPLVGVRCGGWTDAGLAGAVAVHEHPADVLDHLDSLLELATSTGVPDAG